MMPNQILKRYHIDKLISYSLGTISTSAVPFVTLPFLIENLSAAEIGKYAYFESIFLILLPLINFGTSNYLSVRYFSKKNEGEFDLNKSLPIFGFVSMSVLMLACIFLVFLEKFYNFFGDDFYLYVIGIFICYLGSFNMILMSLIRMKELHYQYNLIQFLSSLFYILVIYVIIVWMKNNYVGRIYSLFIYHIASSFVIFFLNKKYKIFNFYLHKRISLKYIIDTFKFGFGVVVHSLSAVVFFTLDRILLGHIVSDSAVGNYYIAIQVGMVMALIQNTYSLIWTPICLKTLSRNEFSKIKLNNSISLIILLVLSILLLLAAYFSIYYLFDEYLHLLKTIIFVIISYTFLGFYKVYSIYIQYFEKSIQLSYITMFTTLINFGFTFFFISKFGFEGAAVGTAISSSIYFLLVYSYYLKLIRTIGYKSYV